MSQFDQLVALAQQNPYSSHFQRAAFALWYINMFVPQYQQEDAFVHLLQHFRPDACGTAGVLQDMDEVENPNPEMFGTGEGQFFPEVDAPDEDMTTSLLKDLHHLIAQSLKSHLDPDSERGHSVEECFWGIVNRAFRSETQAAAVTGKLLQLAPLSLENPRVVEYIEQAPPKEERSVTIHVVGFGGTLGSMLEDLLNR